MKSKNTFFHAFLALLLFVASGVCAANQPIAYSQRDTSQELPAATHTILLPSFSAKAKQPSIDSQTSKLKDIIAQTKAGLMKSQLADAECSVRFEVGDRRSVTVVRIVFKKEKDSSTITAQVIATGHTLKLPFPVACILEKAFASEPFWKTPGGIAGITVGTILGVGAVVALCTGDDSQKPPKPIGNSRRTPPAGTPKPEKDATAAPKVTLELEKHFGTRPANLFNPDGKKSNRNPEGRTVVFKTDFFYLKPPEALRAWAEANNGTFWVTYTDWKNPYDATFKFQPIKLHRGLLLPSGETIDLDCYHFNHNHNQTRGQGDTLIVMIQDPAGEVLWEQEIKNFRVLLKN